MQKTITTKRLILRRLAPDDAAPMAKALNTLEISRWTTGMPHPYSLKDAKDFISLAQAPDSSVFAITFEGRFIGCIGAGKQLGYWLAQPFWRQGITLEAARAVVQGYFVATPANDLKSGHFAGNTGSCAILKRMGFDDTDKGTAICLATGETVKMHHMTLSRVRWEAQI